MAASLSVMNATEIKRKRAWEMHINGATQWDIAAELGCTQGRVCQLIKEAAKANPIVSLSFEERAALSEAKWNQVEHEIRDEIQEQRRNGRVVREVITYPDGKQQLKETTEPGVDPALLRTLSTHIDRRNRQAQNQLSPDAGVQQVNVNVVRDFLAQADSSGGRLTPEQWNAQQGAIDI